MAKSTALTEKEAEALAKEKADSETNIATIKKEELLSFLSGGDAEGYAPSGEVIGISKQMVDEMANGLSEATAQEKMTRVGGLGARLAEMGNDVENRARRRPWMSEVRIKFCTQ
mmetsp:Transcript_81417/g.235345  ORF Transcript_81417/g.235345 Transcript_81417/m.235345 type:complete len:114 (+) Transcript_81417:158-499(+)